MKKTLITSTLVTTLALGGLTGIGSQEADASEQVGNQSELAQKAQANDPSLEQSPVKEGTYDFSFENDGFTYHFWSDGSDKFGYDYKESGQSTQQKDGNKQSFNATPNTNVNTSTYNESKDLQAQPKQVSTSYQAVPQTQQAPKQTTQGANESTQSKSDVQTQQTSTTNASGGSTKAQFLANGGTEAMWQSIVMPESSGNPNASNGQYTGLFQTNQSSFNSSNSVGQQTKGALNYAKERYGSVDEAIEFREHNGWW